MDKYKIDSHKLIYHIDRLRRWQEGENICPVEIEISPTGACNHRCIYCGLDFMGYKPRRLKASLLKERLSEMGRLGIKSVVFAGEGEPFLHEDMSELINHTKASGIDIGVTTNGVLFKKEIADSILADVEWIKAGVDSATKTTHSKIHGCRTDDFDKIIENMSYAAKTKRKNNYACTLGMQFLLLPDNSHEVISLAKIARDIGMDYMVIKPYSQHPQSKTTRYSSIKYSDYEYLSDELAKFNTDDFNLIFRIRTMKKWDNKIKKYDHCLAPSFMSYIDAGGNVWGCSVHMNDQRFLYGNICDQTFEEIWNGEKRKESIRWLHKEFDSSRCRVNCRLDYVNTYLWELKNPPKHVNFI